MAKAGMKRPNVNEPHGTESNKKQKYGKNEPVVQEIQCKAKADHQKATPIE